MNVERSRIVAVLRHRNLDDRADWVQRTLPDIVDLSRNSGLLATLKIEPTDLVDTAPSQ
jgi:hypothetical protein